MVVIPASQIRLYEGLNIKPNQTYYFHSANEQYNFFNDLPYLAQFDNLTYVRDSINTVLVPAPAHTIRTASYMRFRNTANSDNRIYYAYVDSVEYVNEKCSRVVYTVDLLQSYMFKINNGTASGVVQRGWEIGKSYIVRAHTDDDPAMTAPEDYTLSYVNAYTDSPSFTLKNYYGASVRTVENLYFGADMRVALLCTARYNYNGAPENATVTKEDFSAMYSNTFSPARMYYGFQPQADVTHLGRDNLLGFVDTMGKYIVDCYQYPHAFQLFEIGKGAFASRDSDTYEYTGEYGTTGMVFGKYRSLDFADGVEQEIACSNEMLNFIQNLRFPYTTKSGSYTPKSNKLKAFPFVRFVLKCSNGASAVYDLRFFKDNKPLFTADFFTFPRPSARLRPKFKTNLPSTPVMNGGIVLNDFPSSPYTTDALTEYLRANSNTMQTSIQNAFNSSLLNTFTSGVSGAVTGAFVSGGNPIAGVGGAIVGGVSNIVRATADRQFAVQQQRALKADLRNTPDTVQNYNIAPSVAYSSQYAGFEFSIETISGEVAEAIDSYLTRYGYACGFVGEPVLDAMTNYTHIQTAGANVLNHSMPIEAETDIMDIFDAGITLWNPEADIGDYTVTNETR